MKIIPDGEICSIYDCLPGSLVQSVENNEQHLYGVACANSSGQIQGILYFDGGAPTFLSLGGQERTMVLAYRGQLVWQPSRDGSMGSGNEGPIDRAGTIVRTEEGWHLNAFLDNGSPIRKDIVRVELSTGIVARARRYVDFSAWFADWELHFEPMDQPWEGRMLVASSGPGSNLS